jgi:hypothetical protein
VVLDRAAPRRLLHELDEPERVQLAHVVAHIAERGSDLLGQLARTGSALLQRVQYLDAQGVRERLDDARVRDVTSWLHAV